MKPAGKVVITQSNGGGWLAYCAECGCSIAGPETTDLYGAGRKHLAESHDGRGELVGGRRWIA
jgi:hypothetical protein